MITTTAKPTPSWRDLLLVHPAVDRFALVRDCELRSLIEALEKALDNERSPLLLGDDESENDLFICVTLKGAIAYLCDLRARNGGGAP